MIKINLLPHAKRAKTSNTEKQLILFALLLAIITSGIVAAGMWSGSRINEIQDLIREKETQRQMLLTKVGRLNQLERQFKEMESNIEAIKAIRQTQQLPVIYVDEAVRHVPGDKMWFEALNLSRQGVMDIRGVAMDNQTFAGYVDNLRSSSYVRTVSTQRTSSREVMNLDLVEFQFQVRAGPKIVRQDHSDHED